MIKQRTVYTYKGQDYETLKEVQDAVHNTIGEEFLDKMQRVCPLEKHEDYFKLLDLMCSPEIRKLLIECFSVTYTEVQPDIDDSGIYQGDETLEYNILDYKT